jgi:hypothetical protein
MSVRVGRTVIDRRYWLSYRRNILILGTTK